MNDPVVKTLGCSDIYRDFERIGGGSFGNVYKAYHRFLTEPFGGPSPVCVKVRKVSNDPETDRRLAHLFALEARLARQLKQPYLPKLLNYFDIAGRDASGRPTPLQAIVFDYIEGENLQDLVEKNGPVTDEHACWVLDRVLSALCYLHMGGLPAGVVVHSDIKPANIIVYPERHEAVLIDFGLCVMNPNERTRAIGGSNIYAPPELTDLMPPIPEWDFYALGKTLCFMTGGNPATGDPPRDMDHRLARFIDRMTMANPMARPKHTGDLRRELRELRIDIFGSDSAGKGIAYRRSRP